MKKHIAIGLRTLIVATFVAIVCLTINAHGGGTVITTSSNRAFHGARVRHSTTQTATTSVWLNLAWDTEDYDTDAFHSTSSNNDRITIPSGLAGYYRIECSVQWGSNGTGARQQQIRINSGENTANGDAIGLMGPVAAGVTGGNRYQVSAVYHLNAGDEVECFGWQSSGSNLATVQATAHSMSLSLLGF